MEDQRAEEIWWENERRSGRDPGKTCGCPVSFPPEPTYPITYPAYNPFALLWMLCGCQKPLHKTDCYFYFEERQMGGSIPTCSYYNKGLGDCPCEGCKKYVSNADISNIVKETVDKE